MKTEIEMTLFETKSNKIKSNLLGVLEVMLDDNDNPLPDEFYDYWNGEPGKDIPWGTKVKITLEVIK